MGPRERLWSQFVALASLMMIAFGFAVAIYPRFQTPGRGPAPVISLRFKSTDPKIPSEAISPFIRYANIDMTVLSNPETGDMRVGYKIDLAVSDVNVDAPYSEEFYGSDMPISLEMDFAVTSNRGLVTGCSGNNCELIRAERRNDSDPFHTRGDVVRTYISVNPDEGDATAGTAYYSLQGGFQALGVNPGLREDQVSALGQLPYLSQQTYKAEDGTDRIVASSLSGNVTYTGISGTRYNWRGGVAPDRVTEDSASWPIDGSTQGRLFGGSASRAQRDHDNRVFLSGTLLGFVAGVGVELLLLSAILLRVSSPIFVTRSHGLGE